MAERFAQSGMRHMFPFPENRKKYRNFLLAILRNDRILPKIHEFLPVLRKGTGKQQESLQICCKSLPAKKLATFSKETSGKNRKRTAKNHEAATFSTTPALRFAQQFTVTSKTV
jgi:hypothetical protein